MFNRIAMAVLATLLVLQTIRIVAGDFLFPSEHAATETVSEEHAAAPAEEHAAAAAPAEQAAAPAEPAPAEQAMAGPAPAEPAAAPAEPQVAQAPAEPAPAAPAEPAPAAPAAPAAEAASPAIALIATADPAKGKSVSARCIGCHSFGEGEANRVGPNLYNVVGAPIGHVEGYAYSDAFKALNAAGATWTYAELDGFLKSPAQHTPGTKMSFPGVPNDNDRAAVIAYLRTLSASPVPLPGADAAAAPAAPAAPAAAAEPAPADNAGGAMAGPAPAAEPAPADNAGGAMAGPAPAEPAPAAPAEPQVAQAPAEPAPAAPAAEAASPAIALIATADPAKGKSVSARCIGCHSFGEGEANRVGPNLYNVVGAPIGHVEGYAYSDAFKALNAAGATWTYAELDGFLKSPAQHTPGTKMSFPGVPNDNDRAAVIAYLRTLSPSPVPLP